MSVYKRNFIMLTRNALYVPSMHHNILTPFIMRAGGVQVKGSPKINCDNPIVDNHSILLERNDLRIPLYLCGTCSYFNTRPPIPNELQDKDKIVSTPSTSDWNPHVPSFEKNERVLLNHDSKVTSKDRHLDNPMTSEAIPNEIFELASVSTADWDSAIDSNISSYFTHD